MAAGSIENVASYDIMTFKTNKNCIHLKELTYNYITYIDDYNVIITIFLSRARGFSGHLTHNLSQLHKYLSSHLVYICNGRSLDYILVYCIFS